MKQVGVWTSKVYQIVVSGHAENDLMEHVVFLGQKNPAAARRLLKELRERIQSLSEYPNRCPAFYSLTGVEYRKLIVDRYLVIYEVTAKTVEIVRVIDGRSSKNI